MSDRIADVIERAAGMADKAGGVEPGRQRLAPPAVVRGDATRLPFGDALFDILERRVWSHSWRVPEAPWLEAARRLRSELAAEGVALDEPVMVQRHVDLSTIRF